MSSQNYEESDYGVEMDLVIILYYLKVFVSYKEWVGERKKASKSHKMSIDHRSGNGMLRIDPMLSKRGWSY